MKLPLPVPVEVLASAIVGFWDVLQQIPLTVMTAPPSLVMFPPLVAVVEVIAEMAVVVSTGIVLRVLAVTSFP